MTTKSDSTIKQADFEKVFKQHLKIETYSKSIHSLFGPRLLSKIDYKPYYQRNYVWDNNKATYFTESILLGTEIPPLIFFNLNTKIEVIDGRQRFETIKRFMANRFPLTKKGLSILKQLKKCTYDDLLKKENPIIESYLEATIRIIEFALVNEPPLDKFLEDRVKKEIFSRYNSGITPLKKTQIDNAVYDTDNLSNRFKYILKNNKNLHSSIYSTFIVRKNSAVALPEVDETLSFIRRYLVLHRFPIKSYAFGSTRTETLKKLYQYVSDTVVDKEKIVKEFTKKLEFLATVKANSEENNLPTNRLALESFLWGLQIADSEEVKIRYDKELIDEISYFVSENINKYIEAESHFAQNIIVRFSTTASFFEKKYGLDTSLYLNTSAKGRTELKEIKDAVDTIKKIGELESLRLNKPEPSRNSIEDIRRIMQKKRFLIRPSYQRVEVINVPKASAIIESILLGIVLPPIFIYKRNNGVREVVDGQQRLLTILGFTGSKYVDENNSTVKSKNHKFRLRNLKILKEINGLSFDQLPEEQQNRILDFQLYVVEIEEAKNPNFDPVDLFIRLNDKPYPIRDNSFEMWNSWVDFEVIQRLKEIARKNNNWFYVKQVTKNKYRDRMENEELVTVLAALSFFDTFDKPKKFLDIYQINGRINARIANKVYVSQLLTEVTEKSEVKEQFLNCLKSAESFIKKLKYILLDTDKSKDELSTYLKSELDLLFKGNEGGSKYARRTMQNFYFTWYLIHDINVEMVKHHRLEIKKELKILFDFVRELDEDLNEGGAGFIAFIELASKFKQKYRKDERRMRLTEQQKLNLIKSQRNQSLLTGAPIFLGDDIEIDHTIALAVGGKDSHENLQALHDGENRAKGVK